MLSISEELYLLALDEEKGNIHSLAKGTIAHAISGAVLAELALLGIVGSDTKYHLELKNPQMTGDVLLDGAIQAIQSSEKLRKLSYWVGELSQKPKKLRETLGDRLVEKNVLVREDKRFFWKMPECQETKDLPTCKFYIKLPLRGMILADTESDVHSLALLHIARASDLLQLIFTEDEMPKAKRRIQEQMTMKALEFPAIQTVEEIDEAIAIALEDDED